MCGFDGFACWPILSLRLYSHSSKRLLPVGTISVSSRGLCSCQLPQTLSGWWILEDPRALARKFRPLLISIESEPTKSSKPLYKNSYYNLSLNSWEILVSAIHLWVPFRNLTRSKHIFPVLRFTYSMAPTTVSYMCMCVSEYLIYIWNSIKD